MATFQIKADQACSACLREYEFVQNLREGFSSINLCLLCLEGAASEIEKSLARKYPPTRRSLSHFEEVASGS